VSLLGGGAVNNSGSITSDSRSGILAERGALTLTNSGTIRSDGTSISASIPDGGTTDTSRGDGGVVIAAANSTIDNSGSISGRVHGIVVVPQINAQTGVYEGLARNTSITNSGLIRGETDDGIRLAGGGSVTNSGTIEGLSGTNTDGITIYSFVGQDMSNMPAISSVTNLAGGSISGARHGIILSKGGTVSNAGNITANGANAAGVWFQNTTPLAAQAASLTNSGTINSAKYGVASLVEGLDVENSGQIVASGPGYTAGIVTTTSGIRVSNSGLISGTDGIWASSSAANSVVINNGTVRGTAYSGVDLEGSASVTNSGLIEGPSYGVRIASGSVSNLASGTIEGNFYAVDLGSGGSLTNAGLIAGGVRADGNVTLNNSGTITGTTLLNNQAATVIINNSGSTGRISTFGRTLMTNTGSVASLDFFNGDDELTLGAGSWIGGVALGYGGFDLVRLDSGTAPVQTLGSFNSFEQLVLVSGEWVAPAVTGNFNGISLLAGKLTLTGELYGNVNINAPASFQIGTGGSVGGFAGLINNNGSLIVDMGSDFTLAGALSGTGSFLKAGAGRLTLAGIGTHSGPAVISGGTLAVTGQIASQAVFQAGTTLSGTGTVGNVTLRAGATLSPGAGGAPGDGIGTMNLIGQLRFDSGSRYVVNANDAGQADRVNVTGSVVIAPNVIVNVLAQDGNWTTATKYVILSVTQRIVLPFAGVTSDLIFLEPKLSQNSKVVELTLKRKAVKLNSGAVTINQANVADALETINDTNQLMSAVLGQNASGAQLAFDTLSGNFFGSLSNQLVASAGRLPSLLQPAGELAETGIASWSAFTPATRSASSADYRSGFSLAGNGVRLSMVAGWLPQERLARGSTGMASMETHYSGTMLGYAHDGFSASAGAGFSWHRIIADRNVAFPGFADGNQARYRGATRQLFAEVAQSASLGPVSLAPFAGYSDIRVAGMDIREAGGGTGLIIDGQARRLGLAQVGLRTAAALPLAAGTRLSARLNLAWQRAWGDLGSVQNSRFASTGAAFVYQGQQLAGSGLDIDAGLTLERGALAVSAGYRRNSLLQRFDDGAELGLRLRF
jgi:autotransporter-associated beta strand protein